MDLFKPHYRELEAALILYGKFLKQGFDPESATEVLISGEIADQTTEWNRLILNYLQNHTNDEEKKFIAWLFFKRKSIMYCCMKCYLGLRTGQEWKTKQFRNIAALAIQAGLLRIAN